MTEPGRPIYIATRGSALALAQANLILNECKARFPHDSFELKIFKTTGDKLQTLSLNNPNQQATKGLFTKELELALLNNEADFAVHSLKDLPTELPEGLQLAAVTQRAEVRDVLIYRDAEFLRRQPHDPALTKAPWGLNPHATTFDLPVHATVATGSTRRQAQLLAVRPDLKLVPIRGNVGTRLLKLSTQPELDALVLAGAGLQRLQIQITPAGHLEGPDLPPGLLASYLPLEEMVPCVGQGALGIETRANDRPIQEITSALNHPPTQSCTAAERAFLHAMGGGCLSPVAAHAQIQNGQLHIRAVSFRNEQFRRGEKTGPPPQAASLGAQLAAELA